MHRAPCLDVRDTVEPFALDCAPPWLVVRFPARRRAVSWSLNRPGFVDTSSVAWLQVSDSDLPADAAPADWFKERLAAAGLADAVGMMTARNIARFERRTARVEGVEARCVVTLGLNNGERIGRRIATAPTHEAGTVNILCDVSQPLSDAALLEAASLVAQARTLAIVQADYRRAAHQPAVTGTGTDCIVMTAPPGPAPAAFAGMHTAIGEAVGACVLEASAAALRAWIGERR